MHEEDRPGRPPAPASAPGCLRPRGRISRRAMALILVIVVLAALAVIATPFAASMVQQDRLSRNQVDEVHARYAAVGARNAALAQVLQGHDTLEAAPDAKAPFNTPATDTLAEVTVDLDYVERAFDPPAAAGGGVAAASDPAPAAGRPFRIHDPRGAIWGATVSDEQGKVNVRTAPAAVVAALRAQAAALHVSPREFLTDASSVPAEWITPRVVRSTGTAHNDATGLDERWVAVDNGAPFGPGTRVRFWNGTQYLFARIASGGNRFTLAADFPSDYDTTRVTVEAQARHPVNINTAPREVLLALFAGLTWPGKTDEPPYAVSPASAAALADLIIREESGIAGWTGFGSLLGRARALQNDPLRSPDVSALIANAQNPNDSTLAGTGTLPLCFTSGDVYRIRAVGLAGNPAGNQAARAAFADIVAAAPLGVRIWNLVTQGDFDRFLTLPSQVRWSAGCGKGGAVMGAYGPLFGHLVVTHPNATWSDEAPDVSADPKLGDVRLVTAEDLRGNPVFRQSFSNEHEGRDLKGQTLSYPPGPTSIPVPAPGKDVGSGGFEAWWKFRGGAAAGLTLLDVAQAEWMNRLRCSIEGGELVLSASDAGADQMGAQVRAPFTAQPERWYHVGAYWKSNLPGHLLLTLDGLPVGRFTYWSGANQVATLTQLSGPLGATTTTIPCTNTWAATTGGQVLEIGDEAIELPSGGGAIRGARGTTAQAHPAGSLVAPFGYANPVAQYSLVLPGSNGAAQFSLDRIPRTVGKLRESFGVNTACLLAPGPPNQPALTATGTTLTVMALGGAGAPTADFPNEGYLLVGGRGGFEAIYYDDKTPTTFHVGGNGRGVQLPSVSGAAAAHNALSPVFLFSIPVDNVSGYASPGSAACLFQIDDEWFIGTPWVRSTGAAPPPLPPGQPPVPDKDTFLVGFSAAGIYFLPPGAPTGLGRACLYTTHAAHTQGAPVLPVFAVRDGPVRAPGPISTPGGQYGQWAMQVGNSVVQAIVDQGRCGLGDVVTLAEKEPQTLPKEQATVHLARSIRVQSGGAYQNFMNLVSLAAPVQKDYIATGDSATRLLKFPSGELADATPGSVWIGRSEDLGKGAQGIVDGKVDEIKFYSSPRGDFRVAVAVTAADRTVRIAAINGAGGGTAGFLNTGGAIKIEDEVIGYAGATNVGQAPQSMPSGAPQNVDTIELTECVRGYLGTRPADHGPGARIFNLSLLPVGVLNADVKATDATLPLAGGSPQGFPAEGYLLAGGELLGYTSFANTEVRMPINRAGAGIWRGAFGTPAAAHPARELVYVMPFRFWDRARKGVDDDSQAYYQLERQATGALWKRVAWSARTPDRHYGLRALVRLDGRPAWDTPPTNQSGGIWEFTDGTARNKLDARGDRIEVRFLFEFRDAAYADGAWTDTAVLESVRVEFEQPTVTVGREKE